MTRRRSALAPLPRTKAKTPIGILKAVAKAILEEPRRYNQQDWGSRYDAATVKRDATLPACGTVACVAGWVTVLTRPTRVENVPLGDAQIIAARRLGLSRQMSQGELYERLFSPSAFSRVRHGKMLTPREYARAGVRHIERFMRAHLGYTGPKL